VEAAFVGPQPRTEEYDVVVIGSGMAGMSAALSAAVSGARVAIVEKLLEPLAGGNSRVAGGGFCVPQDKTKEARELFIDDFLKKSGGRANKALTENLAENALPSMAWLMERGIEFPEPSPFPPFHVKLYVAPPGWYKGMPKVLGAMLNECKKLGGKAHFQTKAKELLVDDSGRIVGVRASDANGLVDFRAKGTIIASGGFGANRQMLEQWVSPSADESMVRGGNWATGDGHKMAAKAGALLVQMAGLDTLHVAAVHPKNRAAGNPFRLLPYALGINKLGKRYVDESLGYVAHGKAAMLQPDMEVALVFDQALADGEVGKAVLGQFAGLGIEPVKGASLEELAGKIGAPPEALVETVKAFNSAVKDGKALTVDPPKEKLAVRIETAPFYAFYPLRPGITLTFGGIKTNLRRQALEPDGKPIEGLYAAGECVGDYFIGDYVGGGSLIRCLVDGKVSGENAAKG
jgi:flavocytochrome c